MNLILNPYALKSPNFTPDQISGLQLWLKADSLGLADNDPIGTWGDLSGNANDATQGTAGAKPTYKTNIINGLSVARCDGGDRMALTSPIVLSGAYTLYAVGNRANSNAWCPAATYAANGLFLIFLDNNLYMVDDAGTTRSAAYTGSTGSILARWRRASVGATNQFTSTGMAETNLGVLSTITVSDILARSGNETTGDMGEIILYNGYLTAPEDTLVRTYLNTGRWGVSL